MEPPDPDADLEGPTSSSRASVVRAPFAHEGAAEASIPKDVSSWRFLSTESRLPRWAAQRPERILYRSTRSGRWEFWLADLATGSVDRVSTRSRAIDAGALDPSGRWVWLFEDRGGTEHGRWLIRRFEEEDSYLRTPDLPSGYSAGIALGSERVIVGLTDEAGATTVTCLERGRAPRHLATDRLLARVEGIDADGSLVCLSYSGGEFSRRRELRVLDMSGDMIAELSDGPGFDLRAIGWSPIPGARSMLLLHERQDFLRPAIWDVERSELHDLAAGAHDIQEAHDIEARWLPDGRRVLLVHHTRQGGRLEIVDLTTGERQAQSIDSMPPEAEILDLAVRPDDAIWVEWSTPSHPRSVSTPDGPLIEADAPAPEHRSSACWAHAGPVPLIQRRTGDGGGGKRPVVILVHGGPAEQSRPIWSPEAESWAELGFLVLQPNYRGSSGHGRRWRETQRADPAWTEIEDLRRTLRWAVEEAGADPERAILDGRSWGGYLTLLALGRDPTLWSAAIAELPMADPLALYGEAMPSVRRMDAALFGGPPALRPWTYWERSPMTWAARIEAPVLVIRSSRDPRCPPEQIDHFARRLHGLHKRVEVVRIEGGHGPPTSLVRRRLFEQRSDFVRRVLGSES